MGRWVGSTRLWVFYMQHPIMDNVALCILFTPLTISPAGWLVSFPYNLYILYITIQALSLQKSQHINGIVWEKKPLLLKWIYPPGNIWLTCPVHVKLGSKTIWVLVFIKLCFLEIIMRETPLPVCWWHSPVLSSGGKGVDLVHSIFHIKFKVCSSIYELQPEPCLCLSFRVNIPPLTHHLPQAENTSHSGGLLTLCRGIPMLHIVIKSQFHT